jgi:broad specificity phosphatase PhoE
VTTLWLVRHGRTDANASGLLLGRHDPSLDELGRQQAVATAPVVSGARRVVSSPRARARQTAELLGLSRVEVDERWAEIDYGELEGRPLLEVPEETWDTWRQDADFRPRGGESLSDVARRIRPACEELTRREVEVVVVSHVTPIKLALAWALGVSELVSWRMQLSVAAVCRIETGAGGPVVHSYNDTCHLEGLEESLTNDSAGG